MKKGGSFQVEGISQVLAELVEHSMYEGQEEPGIAAEEEGRDIQGEMRLGMYREVPTGQ